MSELRQRPWEWLLGTRYLGATRGRGFLSFISVVSVCGLALGVAVLLVVLSVMNGFDQELRQRILSVTAHGTISGREGRLADWRHAAEVARAQPGVAAAMPYIESQAMLSHDADVLGTLVRGIDPVAEARSVGLAHSLDAEVLASLRAGGYRIVLGDALAAALHVRTGEALILLTPEANVTPAGLAPRMRRMVVAGTFHSGMYEFDRGLALLNIVDAARLYRMGDAVSGLRLALHDPLSAPRTVRAVAERLTGETRDIYFISDWTEYHANLFRAIAMTKSMMFVILSLLVAIAAFNLLATLVMVVKDKRSDIAILRTLGAAPAGILRAFTVQGSLIGLVGTVAGLLLGWLLADRLTSLLAALERATGRSFLDARLYLISDLPTRVLWGDVLRVGLTAFTLCALATLYPAWRAAGTLPAEALRHE